MVARSFFQAIPGAADVLIVMGFVYLVFGLLGMLLFMGRFWRAHARSHTLAVQRRVCGGRFTPAFGGGCRYCEDMNGNQMDPRQYSDANITASWCSANAGSHWLLCPSGACACVSVSRFQRARRGGGARS